jgi:uncharacterized protein
MPLAGVATRDSAALVAAMPGIARSMLAVHRDTAAVRRLTDQARLYLTAEDYPAALATIATVRGLPDAPGPSAAPVLSVLELYATAKRDAARGTVTFDSAYANAFRVAFSRLSDREAYDVTFYLETPGRVHARNLAAALAAADTVAGLDQDAALRLVRAFVIERVQRETQSSIGRLIQEHEAARYVIDPDIRVTTPESVTLSAAVIRPRAARGPLPTVLRYTIYTDTIRNLQSAREAAARGYVSVVADARGKRSSTATIRPYETEVRDVRAVIDWISRQPWSDGRVAMYGGSYDGFAAWAATKNLHPALRTIATAAAAIPGFGLPMEHSVFLNANYGWGFYVSNTPYLDNVTYDNRDRWDALSERWYKSGRPYREIDKVDSTPNPLLQRWLRHPGYDAYWQAMVPYGRDFARIDIPVLTISGYFDDGQISALEYSREHLRYRPNAEHYVVIGPYDHFGSQSARKATELRGYTVDAAAAFSTPDLVFQWFDHVLRDAPRPGMLKGRINYQVMGANTWRHATNFAELGREPTRLYLSDARDGGHRQLAPERPATRGDNRQTVNLADRSTENNGYYPGAVEGRDTTFERALTFRSAPFPKAVELSGSFTARLRLVTNKRDLDVNLVLYEVMPDGRLFHLSYFVGRASYAADPTTRHLLTPGIVATIPIERTRMTSRQLRAGSRLLVVLDVNKDGNHQVNHGTGRDVSDESAADGRVPLTVRWLNDSYIEVPIRK